MEGYTERLEVFLANQTKPKEELVISKEEIAELNKLLNEVENA